MVVHSLTAPDILTLVQDQLRSSSHNYLRCVNCAFDAGVLTLRGRVPSFYLKQTAQALAAKVDGVQQIVNLMDVASPVNAA